MRSPTTVTLLEPWYGGSHKAWADGIQQHCEADVEILGYAASDWRWRLQGSALGYSIQLQDLEPSDVLLASSLVDVATLKGLLPSSWRHVPIAYYLHESQLLHPTPDEASAPRDAVMRNFCSMRVADRTVINSHSHLEDLKQELPSYLRTYGDQLHASVAEECLGKIEVLPLGVDLAWCDPKKLNNSIPRVLWNHRWDFDKDPLAALKSLLHATDQGARFELVWLGENVLEDDRPVMRLLERLGEIVVHVGALQGSAYHAMLHSCDFVISTARHETFGIAAVEALAAGCTPIFPDRLSYPELLGADHADLLYAKGCFGSALRENLKQWPTQRSALASSMHRFDWAVVAPLYDDLFSELTSSERTRP